VTGAYGLEESSVLEDDAGTVPRRLVAEVEHHFASLPPWAPQFDSFAPASYLFENTATLRATLPDLDLALDRFEKLFRDLHGVASE
jgi:hypothetical protein